MASDAPHLDEANDPPPEGAPNSPDNSLVPVNRRVVTWGPNGTPMVKEIPMLTRAVISEIAMAAASMPYSDPDDDLAIEMGLPPSEFYGMTNLEVMIIKRTRNAALTGDEDKIEKVLDRLIGKPKAISEQHRVTETYEEFLSRTAKEAEAIPEAEVVDEL